ncbi:MAG: hypothetical protein L0Z62_08065 [Gemmataceae bacterium]|nr:hypothetical protein [Gemmataceae bacterium]
MAASKTVCPVSREEFRNHARNISVSIAGMEQMALVKEFSTGSLGWNINGKMVVNINGKPVTVQVGLNLTVVGSKELAQSNGQAVAVAAGS